MLHVSMTTMGPARAARPTGLGALGPSRLII